MKSREEYWNRVFWETFNSSIGPLIEQAKREGVDTLRFLEQIATRIGVVIGEGFHFSPKWRIDRYRGEDTFLAGRPYDISCFSGNVALNEGLNLITTLVCGGAGDAANNANAQVGTGTSSTAADPTDSALTAGVWAGMDSGYPTYGASQQMAFKGTYGTSTANQDWKEFAVRNKSTADIMLSRKVQDEGTKPSGQIWVLTVTYTGA